MKLITILNDSAFDSKQTLLVCNLVHCLATCTMQNLAGGYSNGCV